MRWRTIIVALGSIGIGAALSTRAHARARDVSAPEFVAESKRQHGDGRSNWNGVADLGTGGRAPDYGHDPGLRGRNWGINSRAEGDPGYWRFGGSDGE